MSLKLEETILLEAQTKLINLKASINEINLENKNELTDSDLHSSVSELFGLADLNLIKNSGLSESAINELALIKENSLKVMREHTGIQFFGSDQRETSLNNKVNLKLVKDDLVGNDNMNGQVISWHKEALKVDQARYLELQKNIINSSVGQDIWSNLSKRKSLIKKHDSDSRLTQGELDTCHDQLKALETDWLNLMNDALR